MANTSEILIVGAGPTGLSMAIFLHELGYKPRIIDKKTQISDYSKAFGVNPRTLEILEPYGITDRFLRNGRKMKAVNIWKADKYVYKNDFTKVKHKYPFMLVQVQKESEEILKEEVLNRKIDIEYDTEFQSYTKMDSQYSVAFKGHSKEYNFDYLIGADGPHSLVREQAGIEQKGFNYEKDWELYDIELETDIARDEAHIRVFPEGGMIMIMMRDNIWRVAGNMKSLLNYLPKRTKAGKISWESTFRIHHKTAKRLVEDGKIVLIGDAAHLHSPVGARGMNLGIEDAYLSSQLIGEGRLKEYDKIRRPYLEKTVNRIDRITIGLAGDSKVSRIIRNQFDHFRFLFPLVIPEARKFILGLS